MPTFAFDNIGFRIGGEDRYLVSGEFHYFRVPRDDWKRRMQLFLDAGGNTLATYVPWLIHEPEEGTILFGDRPERDLAGFLSLAGEMGLNVLLRPGPYQYSELKNGGLPTWLLDNYPEILARNVKNETFTYDGVSYLHPVFLEKARKYYKAFAEVVRPFMAQNGGPVVMLQVDNELTGIHIWRGSMDYHPVTMGFGKADGRYPRWLGAKYADITALNAAYETEFASFADVLPLDPEKCASPADNRRTRDYYDFYHATIAEYASLLASWLREDGLDAPICHNAANPESNAYFTETVEKMGEGFLLGSDHYYNLDADWPQNSPTPQYALRMLMSADELSALGMPPVAFELPGGSPSDTPPILPEDLLACYMTNLALGLKGVNYYVYTGGPNFSDTGDTADIYDYNAHVRADGSLNETYASLRTFGDFMKKNAWLQRARRVGAVQVGFDWNLLRGWDFDRTPQRFGIRDAEKLMERGLLYALMCSDYAPELTLTTGKLDPSRPLILPCPSALSRKSADAVVNFVREGGSLLLLPVMPETDEEYQPCEGLKDLFPDAAFAPANLRGAVDVKNVGHVYGISAKTEVTHLPEGAEVLATDASGAHVLGFLSGYGKGKVIFFGGSFKLTTFPQAEMLESFLYTLGAEKTVRLSNRHIFKALWEGKDGRRMLFLMNLYSGKQSTDVTVFHGGEKSLGRFDLLPMEVKVIDLNGKGDAQ